jgi:transposase
LAWQYARARSRADPGVDASVLGEFRARLIAGQAERRRFATLLTRRRDHGLVKAGGAQRTDATHVLAALHALNRLELLGEPLRPALKRLAVVAPAWVGSWVPPAWGERSGKQISTSRLPTRPVERTRRAEQLGTDGRHLLTRLQPPTAPPWAQEVPAVEPWQPVWQQP